MKRLVTIVAPAILVVGLALSGLSDTRIAIADTSVPNDEVASSKANNASATATITIVMYAVDDERQNQSFCNRIQD